MSEGEAEWAAYLSVGRTRRKEVARVEIEVESAYGAFVQVVTSDERTAGKGSATARGDGGKH